MESERERLGRLYAELGDEHLQDLADDTEDLTDDGRLALAVEMQKRGFSARPKAELEPRVTHGTEFESGFGPSIPGIVPGGAASMEQALEHGGATRLGWSSLVSFFDGIELSRACGFLEDANVDFAIEEQGRDAMSGAPSSFDIWVESPDVETAQEILRAQMGLFPLGEMEVGSGLADDTLVTLGDFKTLEEATQATHLLAQAGIHFILDDPETLDDETWYGVEVKAADLERGLHVVSAGLGMTT